MLAEKLQTALGQIKAEVAEMDYEKTGCHLEAKVKPEQVQAMAEAMKGAGLYLEDVTAVDFKKEFEVLYHFVSTRERCRVVGRCRIPRDEPMIPSIARIYGGANWHERETFDMFGVKFSGHPDLKRILLPEDATIHPLRKD